MEDDIKFFGNGRRSQVFAKMEDNLNLFGKRHHPFGQNGRQPQM
jgi:hypothetical protein